MTNEQPIETPPHAPVSRAIGLVAATRARLAILFVVSVVLGGASLRANERYDAIIEHQARRHGVRPELVRAVIQVESNFDPLAVSSKGALGLMQLMPATAEALRVENVFDPRENIRGGVEYLRSLLERYDHDERLALAAYNAGPTAVARHGNRVPPYRETRDYIRKVQSATALVAPAPSLPVGPEVIYRVDSSSGSPVYTNIRPAAPFAIVRTDR